MRGGGEREPVVVVPLVVGVVVVRVEGVIVVTVRGQEVRVAVGNFYGLVHRDDPPESHLFDLRVCEHVADEAGYFCIGLGKLALVSLLADVLGGAILIATPQDPLEYHDLSRDATGRLEVGREKHALGVQTHRQASRLEVGDPSLAGQTVGDDRKGDDSVLLAPTARRFGNHRRLVQKTQHPINTPSLSSTASICAGVTRLSYFTEPPHSIND